jgi:hypothetical protein
MLSCILLVHNNVWGKKLTSHSFDKRKGKWIICVDSVSSPAASSREICGTWENLNKEEIECSQGVILLSAFN